MKVTWMRSMICLAAFLIVWGHADKGWASVRKPAKLSLAPANPFLFGKGARQPLVAVAEYSDGTGEEVTRSAAFLSQKPRWQP